MQLYLTELDALADLSAVTRFGPFSVGLLRGGVPPEVLTSALFAAFSPSAETVGEPLVLYSEPAQAKCSVLGMVGTAGAPESWGLEVAVAFTGVVFLLCR